MTHGAAPAHEPGKRGGIARTIGSGRKTRDDFLFHGIPQQRQPFVIELAPQRSDSLVKGGGKTVPGINVGKESVPAVQTTLGHTHRLVNAFTDQARGQRAIISKDRVQPGRRGIGYDAAEFAAHGLDKSRHGRMVGRSPGGQFRTSDILAGNFDSGSIRRLGGRAGEVKQGRADGIHVRLRYGISSEKGQDRNMTCQRRRATLADRCSA